MDKKFLLRLENTISSIKKTLLLNEDIRKLLEILTSLVNLENYYSTTQRLLQLKNPKKISHLRNLMFLLLS